MAVDRETIYWCRLNNKQRDGIIFNRERINRTEGYYDSIKTERNKRIRKTARR